MMWLRSTWLGVTDTSVSPRAKNVVNTTPMAASSLTRLVLRTTPMSATARKPQITAPTANGTPAT